jgi:hypothetical protein
VTDITLKMLDIRLANWQSMNYQQDRRSQMDSVTVVVPSRFYNDHKFRDLPSGKVIKEYSNGKVKVVLSQKELSDLLSDAQYYSECADQFDSAYQGVCKSATATVKAIHLQTGEK